MVAIVDRNGLKAMDETACGKVLDPLAPRWTSFGWAAIEIDGHDMAAICDALDWAERQTQRPAVIIANTVKGKGSPSSRDCRQFHNAALDDEQYCTGEGRD